MVGNIIEPEIKALIEERKFSALREVFSEWPPADLAELIRDLPVEEQVIVFRLLPHHLAADTFEYLEFDDQERLLKAMGQEQVVAILNEMSPDDRTAMLEELPSAAVTQLVRLLTPDERRIAVSLLGYPEESVGRLMTPDYVAIRDGWTVSEVLDHVRRTGRDSETLNVLYVVDERGRLIDDIRIREFLLRPLDARVSDIRDRSFVALHVSDPQEEAISAFRKYDRSTLPVVDSDGVLVGIVTVDDVLDIVEEEATEDIHKLGGMEAMDEPYMNLPLAQVIRKRAVWLVVLFLGQLLTATAIGFFGAEIERAVILAMFMPLIISSGGNAGSQAATLMVRAIALGEIALRDWVRVLLRELSAGLLLGLILASLGFVRLGTQKAIIGLGPYDLYWLQLASTIALSIWAVVLWGTVCGALLPFLLKRCRIDPATSSAPLVATLVDVTGLVIYFTIATLVLRGTIL